MNHDADASDRCLSLVIPCFNEVVTVARCIERGLAQPFVGEVIVVDDGSTDGTAEVLAGLPADARLVLERHPVNRGKGAALRTGFAQARKPFVAVQDADLEYDPAELAKLLAPLLAGDADVVYGSRFLTTEAHRVLYYWHSLGNKFLTALSNMTTNLNLTDMETCYKVFRRDVLDRIIIEEDRFGFEPEVTAKVAALGCRVYEVGISYRGRSYAEGKKIGWRDGVRAAWAIVHYSARARVDRRRRAHRPDPAAEGDPDHVLAPTLETLATADRYADWMASLVLPWVHGRSLEVGAGHGTFTERLAGPASELVVAEPSEAAAERLGERFADHPRVTVLAADLEEAVASGPFESVVLLNVLEHLADDDKALAQIREALLPGGNLVLWVPAFEALYSDFDRRIGHHRRYRQPELRAQVERAGFEVALSRYVNLPGWFGWLVAARILRVLPTSPGLVRRYDRFVVPPVRALESAVAPPFGQSLLVIAHRG